MREVRDATVLRALAHPLRLRILGALRLDGPATASDLGRRLGESSGATSYHVRQLARHGFVEEVAEEGTARERWWRAVDRGTEWQLGTDESDELAAGRELAAQVLRLHAAWAETWLAQLHEWPAEWRTAAALGDRILKLDAPALIALGRDVEDVLERYATAPPAEEGAETVAVAFHALPLRGAP